jgi:hypothetical protein
MSIMNDFFKRKAQAKQPQFGIGDIVEVTGTPDARTVIGRKGEITDITVSINDQWLYEVYFYTHTSRILEHHLIMHQQKDHILPQFSAGMIVDLNGPFEHKGRLIKLERYDNEHESFIWGVEFLEKEDGNRIIHMREDQFKPYDPPDDRTEVVMAKKAQMTDDESNELEHEAALQQVLNEIIEAHGYGAIVIEQLDEIAAKSGVDQDTLAIEYFGKSEPVINKAVAECQSMISEGFPIDKAAELCGTKHRVPKSIVKGFVEKYEQEGWTPDTEGFE